MPDQINLVDPLGTIASVQVDGNLASGQQLAARTSVRPMDFGQPFGNYGSYSYSGTTGTEAAGGGAVIVAAFRNSDPNRLMLIRRIRVHQGWIVTTFAAGACVASLKIIRQYTVIDSTGGTLQTLTGNAAKRRATMGNSQATLYLATTGALSGGTGVADTTPLAVIVSACLNVAGTPLLEGAKGNLWDANELGKYPIVLANNEGFQITSTAPATGTYAVSVDLDWDEVAAF